MNCASLESSLSLGAHSPKACCRYCSYVAAEYAMAGWYNAAPAFAVPLRTILLLMTTNAVNILLWHLVTHT
jgi:hypothetical protein